MFAIGIFYLFFIKPSKNSLLRIFIMNGYYSLSDDFSLSWFPHFILLMWWIVVIFPIFTPILYSWNKLFFWSWCIVMLGVPKTTLRLDAVLGALSIQLCSYLRFIRHGPNKRKQREQGHNNSACWRCWIQMTLWTEVKIPVGWKGHPLKRPLFA